MRKGSTARLLVLSAALGLPVVAAAQFPYSAWTCDRAEKWCSPAVIPAQGKSIVWGQAPEGPPFVTVPPTVSDATTNSFTKAFAKIEEISQGVPAGTAAEGQAQGLAQAHSKALQTLQAANIDREKYNDVAVFMNRDLDLRMRVFGAMD